MKYSRYPAYKDSGVEWLGEVPEGWQFRKTKYLFDIQSREPQEGEEIVTAFRDGVVTLRSNRRVDGFTNSVKEIGYQGVRVNDLVIHAMDAFAGAIGVSDSDGKSTPVYSVCKAHDESVSPPFYGRLLRTMALTGYIASLSKGIRERSTEFRWKEAGNLMLPVPTIEDQTRINTFLDRETAKLDTLIAKQEKLIELLQQKRQALISHAVTKGLNPDAPMKDSGVAWLGEVPGHWEVRSISSISTKITNGYVGPTRDILVEEGVRYLQSLHIKGNAIKFDTPYYVTDEWSNQHRKSILQTGDVLIVQTGDIGQVAVVPDEFAGCNCHALIIVAPLRDVLDGTWLSWVLNSSYGFHSLLSIQTGALHPHLNCGNVKDLAIPLPPLAEQQEIVDWIIEQNEALDTLIEKSRRSIELMREHRTALISAAVTGKIDVREAA